MQKQTYSREQIIAILQECYEENLGSLTSGEYSKLRDEPSAHYIKRKFNGSWHQALKAASLPYKEAYLAQA